MKATWSETTKCWELVWQGKRPVPESVFFDNRFAPLFTPEQEIPKGKSAQPFPVFTRDFKHSLDSDASLDPEVIARFQDDGCRFPAFTYKAESLLWRDTEWRQPHSAERAAMMSIPKSVIQALHPMPNEKPRATEARRASAVGNSFHVPSIMLAIVMLFQLVPQCQTIPVSAYEANEQRLRRMVKGTSWEPGKLESCQQLSSVQDLDVFLSTCFADVLSPVPPLKTSPHLEDAVRKLQIYKVDRILRELPIRTMGPDWAQQAAVGRSAAALGTQRGSALHKHASSEYAAEIMEFTMQEIEAGVAEGPFSAEQLHERFGRDQVPHAALHALAIMWEAQTD